MSIPQNGERSAHAIRGLDARAIMSFHQCRPLAPDRLRSFLKYLQERESPVRFSGFPANLYLASERLASSAATLQVDFSDDDARQKRHLALRVHPKTAGNVLNLDFGSFVGLASLLASAATLEMLAAGARILASEYAVLALEGLSGPAQPVAVWVDALSSMSGEPGSQERHAEMNLLQEQWDGARLWLRREPPLASDQQLTISALMLDAQTDRDLLLAALNDALRSTNWKVRACAMIGATRRGLGELGHTIKRMDIPETSIPGVTGELRHMLLAMRKASLLLLSGTPLPQMADAARDTRVGMQAHLLRLMAGEAVTFEDEFSTLINSLISGDFKPGPRTPQEEK